MVMSVVGCVVSNFKLMLGDGREMRAEPKQSALLVSFPGSVKAHH
jgi:hypothetical protein